MLSVFMTPLGVRAEPRSVAAMNAPRTKATVVKKPKTFWSRVKELCMLGNLLLAPAEISTMESIGLLSSINADPAL